MFFSSESFQSFKSLLLWRHPKAGFSHTEAVQEALSGSNARRYDSEAYSQNIFLTFKAQVFLVLRPYRKLVLLAQKPSQL
jgi:hypothetical protein